MTTNTTEELWDLLRKPTYEQMLVIIDKAIREAAPTLFGYPKVKALCKIHGWTAEEYFNTKHIIAQNSLSEFVQRMQSTNFMSAVKIDKVKTQTLVSGGKNQAE